MRPFPLSFALGAVCDAVGQLHEHRPELPLGETAAEREHTARQVWWMLARGKGVRSLWIENKPNKSGKLKSYVKLGDARDLVIARVIAGELRRQLDCYLPHVPPQHVGCELVALARHKPDSWLLQLDLIECWESIDPFKALSALEKLGAHPAITSWLRGFYRRWGKSFRGLGRGIAWSPILAAAYMLPLYNTSRDLRYWVGDDLIYACKSESAAIELEGKAREVLASLGLQAHTDRPKYYRGPVTGQFTFAGLDFARGRANLKSSTLERLHPNALDTKNMHPWQIAETVMSSLRQFPAALGSTSVCNLIRSYEPISGSETSNELISKQETSINRYTRSQGTRRVSQAINRLLDSTLSLTELNTHTPFSDGSSSAVARNNCANAADPGVRPIGQALGSIPELLRNIPDPYTCQEAYWLDRFGLGVDQVDRISQVIKVVNDYCTFPSLDPPIKLVRALMQIRSKRNWADQLIDILIDKTAVADLSGKESVRCATRNLRRAHRRKGKYGGRVRWSCTTADGGHIEARGSCVFIG